MLAALAVALVGGCGAEAPTAAAIAPEELSARLGSDGAPVILDVRTEEEFASGHIPGAVNIPHDELALRLSELVAAPDAEIVVHCERGGRAAAAEEVLRESGYSNVRDLSGHMQAWRADGLPVE